MPLDTVPWDVVDYLDSEDAISGYLSAVLEENDPKLLVAALGDVARAKGMAGIASETGLSRESLYKSLSQEGNPGFATIVKVIDALGLKLEIRPKSMKTPEAA